MQPPSCLRLFLLAASLLACPTGQSRGQEDRPQRFQEAVTISVDADAAKTLLTISDRWEAGQWQTALEDLISLCESRPHALVQVDDGSATASGLYQPVYVASERWLSIASPAALARYRERMDPAAQRAWERWKKTRNPALLDLIAEQYRFTTYGAEAVWELGLFAWTTGDLERAQQAWRSLLPREVTFLPGPVIRLTGAPVPVADIAAYLVLCDLYQRDPAMTLRLHQFREQFPNEQGTLGGQKGRWADLLTQAARSFESRDSATASFSTSVPQNISTFGGNNTRQMLPGSLTDVGSPLWSRELPALNVPRQPVPSLYPQSSSLPYLPAVQDDTVYLNDGQRIWAWNLFSGQPAWDTSLTGSALLYPGLAPTAPLAPRRPVRGQPLFTISIHAGRLLARMGSVVTTPATQELRDQESELICLDLAQGEGRLLWSLPSTEISRQIPSEDVDLPAWVWEGTPLVQGSRVYGLLSRRRPQVEWSVVCLDLESGRLLWHRPIGMARPTPPDHENLSSHLLLAAADGRLFIATHWGAVICLEMQQGHLCWAATYPAESIHDVRPRPGLSAAPPCLIVNDQVFVAPSDSHRLLCFESRTGRLRWQQPVEEPMEHLLGVRDGQLIASGKGLWAFAEQTGKLSWRIQSREPELWGYGRGCLTPAAVIWPTRQSLLFVQPGTGTLLREHPLETPLTSETGGHLLVSDGVLLITGSQRLTAYGEYARPTVPSPALSQQPLSPRELLKQAELAERSGHREVAQSLRRQVMTSSTSTDSRWKHQASARWLSERFAGSAATVIPHPPLTSVRIQEPNWQALPLSVSQRRAVLKAILRDETSGVSQTTGLADWLATAWQQPRLDDDQPTLWEVARRRQQAEPAATRASSKPLVIPTAASEETPSSHTTAPTFTGTGYWRRAWQQTRPAGACYPLSFGSNSSEIQGLLLATPKGMSFVDLPTGQMHGAIYVTETPSGVVSTETTTVVISSQELLALNPTTGTVRWRRESPLAASSSVSPQWHIDDEGLLLCDPRAELTRIDLQTGDTCWRRDLSSTPWNPAVLLHSRHIIAQEQESQRGLILNAQTGQECTRFAATRRWWTRPPVLNRSETEMVLVDDRPAVTGWSLSGESRWEYRGLVSADHQPPLVFDAGSQWKVLLEGLRVAGVSEKGGVDVISPLSLYPVRHPETHTLVKGPLLFAGESEELRGIGLSPQKPLWSVPLQGSDILALAYFEPSSQLLMLRHERNPPAHWLELREARTGRLCQSIPMTLQSEFPPQVLVDREGFTVATATLLERYLPWTDSNRLAASSLEPTP